MSSRYQYWLDNRCRSRVRGLCKFTSHSKILRWWEYREIWRKHVKMKHIDASVSFFWTRKVFSQKLLIQCYVLPSLGQYSLQIAPCSSDNPQQIRDIFLFLYHTHTLLLTATQEKKGMTSVLPVNVSDRENKTG